MRAHCIYRERATFLYLVIQQASPRNTKSSLLRAVTGTNHTPFPGSANVWINPKVGDTWSNKICSKPWVQACNHAT